MGPRRRSPGRREQRRRDALALAFDGETYETYEICEAPARPGAAASIHSSASAVRSRTSAPSTTPPCARAC